MTAGQPIPNVTGSKTEHANKSTKGVSAQRRSPSSIWHLLGDVSLRLTFLHIRHSTPATAAARAANLISTIPDLPVRTLDATHLVIAREIDASNHEASTFAA
jgi:hypothetical protein